MDETFKDGFVCEKDLIPAKITNQMPYLKAVELIIIKPQILGLDKWKTQMTIPNSMMKLIYKNLVYKDTDLPEPDEETFSKSQLRLIDDTVQKAIKFERFGTSGSRNKRPPLDEMTGMILTSRPTQKPVDIEVPQAIDGNGDPIIDPVDLQIMSRIAICRHHKVQPTEVIVELALQKMFNLDPEDEETCRRLFNDAEFMRLLDYHVAAFNNSQKDRDT